MQHTTGFSQPMLAFTVFTRQSASLSNNAALFSLRLWISEQRPSIKPSLPQLCWL